MVMSQKNTESPFAHRAFTILWMATVLSNIGTWMHDVGAGWLMTSMTASPIWVALIQTATSLPVFLLALPAGALADVLDRRRLLIVVQVALSLCAALLGVLVFLGQVTPFVLLAFTFVMGIGAALTAPAWQAIVPSLVPRAALQQAVATNSVGINISRAIGPALAGLLITIVGIAMPFLINALSYLIVVAALIWWSPPAKPQRKLPVEDIRGAMRAGVRYALHSKPLKATIVRAIGFFVFASAYWAMLPLIVKQLLHGDASLYGILLGCIGGGAVAGALLIPRLKKIFSVDHLVMLGSIGTALTMLFFALFPYVIVAALACIVAGVSWITVLTCLNVSAQTSLPDWVRARGLAIFVTVFFGCMSLGSLLWGQVASSFDIPTALVAAATGLLLFMPITRKFSLQQVQSLDLAPSAHWPEPMVTNAPEHDAGPVMVTIEYLLASDDVPEFVRVMDELSQQRYRDGAYAWGIFEDTAQKGRFLEYFLVLSWLEHLRQHERVTQTDQALQDKVRQLHIGKAAPQVTHLIAPNFTPTQ